MLQKMYQDANQFEINSFIYLSSSGLNSIGSTEKLIIILSPPASYILGTLFLLPILFFTAKQSHLLQHHHICPVL